MSRNASPPVVGIACNFHEVDGFPGHRAGHKYVEAVAAAAGCLPVLLPALGEDANAAALLERLDGVLLTGGISNVEPHRYGGQPSREGVPHDPLRDGLTLRVILEAVDRAVPLLGICRGIQEINVAFGGSLHQHLHEVPGRMDHRRDREAPREVQFAPRHTLAMTPGGLLERIADGAPPRVNSLHGQGIDRLGEGLALEATAEDGTIEAVSVIGAPGFALGVQWHPEIHALENPLYTALFRAFGDAARARADERTVPRPLGQVA